jgi:predicted nucleotidyltransferase
MTNRRTEIKKWLKTVLEENLRDVSYRAFIFGSQANKVELIRSDIDLGILSDNSISPINLVRINNAIEDLPMLYKVDLVDFNEVDEKFKTVALKNIEWL